MKRRRAKTAQPSDLSPAQIRLNGGAYWSFLIGSVALLYAAYRDQSPQSIYEKLAAVPLIGGPIVCLPLKKWGHVHRLSSALGIFSCACMALRAKYNDPPDAALFNSQVAMIGINLYSIFTPDGAIKKKLTFATSQFAQKAAQLIDKPLAVIDKPLAVSAMAKLTATAYTSIQSSMAHNDGFRLAAFLLICGGYLCQSLSRQPNIRWQRNNPAAVPAG